MNVIILGTAGQAKVSLQVNSVNFWRQKAIVYVILTLTQDARSSHTNATLMSDPGSP